MAATHKIRIKLRAYDHRLLDLSTGEIVATLDNVGIEYCSFAHATCPRRP